MKLIKKIWKSKIFYTGIFLVVFLLPSAIYASAETEKRAVITALGIDKINNEIEVSVNVVIPNGGGQNSEDIQSLSGKGVNLSTALNSISLSLGKIVGLAHCEVIVLSNSVLEEDVIRYLDYFIRTNNLSTNASLVCTPSLAKDVIESSSTDNNKLNLDLKNIVDFNDEFLFTTSMTVEKFYQEYFSYSQSSFINLVEVLPMKEASENNTNKEVRRLNLETAGLGSTLDEEEGSEENSEDSSGGEGEEQGAEESGSGSSSQQSEGAGSNVGGMSESNKSAGGEKEGASGESGGGDEKAKKKITNSGKVALIKKGKFVRELKPEEISAYNYISRETQKGSVVIGEVNNEFFEDATLTFEVVDKKLKHKTFFNNGVPIYKINLNLIVKLDEVNMKNFEIGSIDSVKTFVDKNIIEKMKSKIKNNLSVAVNEARNNNIDSFQVYKQFNAFHQKEWKKYLKSLEKPEEYIKNILFQFDIHITGKF